MYPLKFQPVYKEKIWGGRKIGEIFNRDLPPGKIGESWDVAAHPHGHSEVVNGELHGQTLESLFTKFGRELLGSDYKPGKFPLLVKLIDANDDLSVQVHPDDQYALANEAGDPGKTEMWYVLAAEPGGKIVYGLKPGVTSAEFSRAIAQGTIMECLNQVDAHEGDVFQIPAGLVHALGAGVLVAEVQQNSDTVYRVYDWDRLDDQGQARELHIDKALAVIDFEQQLKPSRPESGILVANEYFVVEKLKFSNVDENVSLGDKLHILMSIGGSFIIDTKWKLDKGESCLIPASCGSYQLQGTGTLLKVYLP